MNKNAWVNEYLEEIRQMTTLENPPTPCLVEGCQRTPLVSQLCKQHYRRAQRAFAPKPIERVSNGH